MYLQNFIKIKRKHAKWLFALYGCALLYAVFLTPNRYRGDENLRLNLVPVAQTVRLIHIQGNEHFWPYYLGYWGNIFGNIILFLPFGFLCTYLYPEKKRLQIFLYGLMLSIAIELMQLLLRIGVCDIDDVILNVIGTLTGIGLYNLLRNRKPE